MFYLRCLWFNGKESRLENKMSYPAIWRKESLMPLTKEESSISALSRETSDFQLIELALAGEENAFEQIFTRYKKLVAIIASRYFHQSHQIEEVIQIVFVKAFFELGDFRGNHGFSLPSWLGRITTNVCLNTLRSQKRKPENSYSDLSCDEIEYLRAEDKDGNKNAESTLINRDLAEKLLSRLAVGDRVILQMMYSEDMSVKEIAEVTGQSKANIKIRAFRARYTLRKILIKFL